MLITDIEFTTYFGLNAYILDQTKHETRKACSTPNKTTVQADDIMGGG